MAETEQGGDTGHTAYGDELFAEYDDADDDEEVQIMLAKVQTLQNGANPQPAASTSGENDKHPADSAATVSPRAPDVTAQRRQSRSSSGASSTRSSRDRDGITTVSRHTPTTFAAIADALHHGGQPSLFQKRLLETAKQQQPQALERMKKKISGNAPAKLAKRLEVLADPKKTSDRKFATDDEAKNCRFTIKPKKAKKSGSNDEESSRDSSTDFIARMEAAERNKQKRLEDTRGEQDYQANLNKKICPKCQIAQSYSEYRDKKKRCQICGSEFRLPQAWGDVGRDFIERMGDHAFASEQRKMQIRAQVVQHETQDGRVQKSTRQKLYEKQLHQQADPKNFLGRNCPTSTASKTKLAQTRLEQQLKAQRGDISQLF